MCTLPLEVSNEQWMSSVIEPTSDDPSRVATGRADEQAPNGDGQRRHPAGVPLPKSRTRLRADLDQPDGKPSQVKPICAAAPAPLHAAIHPDRARRAAP